MLEITNLTKTFNPGTVNEKTALDGLNLSIADGDFVTVIGGNGAGKSTMLNAIAGVWKPDQGSIKIDGVDVTHMPEHKRAQFLGRVFQDPMMGTAPDMEIAENLGIAARRGTKRRFVWGVRKAEREEYKKLLATLELGLESRLSAKVGLLSGGQRQALALAMVFMRPQKLYLLDEPSAGLSPKAAKDIIERVRCFAKEDAKRAVLMVEHRLDLLAWIDRAVFLSQGKVRSETSDAGQFLDADWLAKNYFE